MNIGKEIIEFNKQFVCFLYATDLPKGITRWDMESLHTGKHSINEKTELGRSKRVVNHWNGFIDNQPKNCSNII